MQPPPRVGLALRRAGGGVLPGFLPAVGREVEEAPDAAESFDAPPVGELCPPDHAAFAQKDVEAEPFSDAEIGIEVVTRLDPGHGPAHARLEGLNLGQRRFRDHDERGVPRAKMREVRQAIGEHSAAGARVGIGRLQHVVVNDQLIATVKEVGQTRLAHGSFKPVGVLDQVAWAGAVGPRRRGSAHA